MPLINARTDLPVLLVYDLDRTYGESDAQEAASLLGQLTGALARVGHTVTSLPVCSPDWTNDLANLDSRDWVVLNWCDGVPGVAYSDAHVARELGKAGFTYTGSHYPVLNRSWDKPYVKRLLESCGLPTPRWRLYDRPSTDGWDCFPAIVKPSHEHSSLGVTPGAVVLTPETLCERVAYVVDTFHQPALVEDFVDGREFHVSVWGNHTLQVLPPAEMDFGAFGDIRDRLCTFDAKFTPGSRPYEEIGLLLPAPLSQAEQAALEWVALASYQALGCRDYGRLDIRLRDGVFYVLDINPNCDISPDASMALAAAVDGYSYGAMLSQIVNLAATRHPVFRQHRYSVPRFRYCAPRSRRGWRDCF
jgi:D-alanine-D-alanine ligase